MTYEEMISEVVEVDRYIATAQQHCEDYQIPLNVYIWRKRRGMAGKDLFKTPEVLVHFQGESCTLRMLAEKAGIPHDIVRRRYDHGWRGAKLGRDYIPGTEKGQRERLKAQCKTHLRRLLLAHRERAINILKGASTGDHEEPFDYAAAVINAQRFEEAARDHLTRSTGQLWDAA